MKWQEYEKLTKDVYQKLGKASGVEIECWGPSCRAQGKSREWHQFDVLTSHGDGIHIYRTAIECKYWNKKISKGQVLELAGKIEDAMIEKGILVSKLGFTQSALTIAKDRNIGLVQLRQPILSDWDGFLKEITGEINYIVDEVYDYKLICRNEDLSGAHTGKVAIGEVLVELASGTALSVSDIADDIREASNSNNGMEGNGYAWERALSPEDETRTYVVKFYEGAVLRHAIMKNKPQVTELRFKIKQIVLKSQIHIDHQDFVSWIMHAIFENKTFAISSDGMPTPWEGSREPSP